MIMQVIYVDNHKYLGITFDSKLTFAKQINEKLSTSRKGVVIITHLS